VDRQECRQWGQVDQDQVLHIRQAQVDRQECRQWGQVVIPICRRQAQVAMDIVRATTTTMPDLVLKK
jgi:hypothetical protein